MRQSYANRLHEFCWGSKIPTIQVESVFFLVNRSEDQLGLKRLLMLHLSGKWRTSLRLVINHVLVLPLGCDQFRIHLVVESDQKLIATCSPIWPMRLTFFVYLHGFVLVNYFACCSVAFWLLVLVGGMLHNDVVVALIHLVLKFGVCEKFASFPLV